MAIVISYDRDIVNNKSDEIHVPLAPVYTTKYTVRPQIIQMICVFITVVS